MYSYPDSNTEKKIALMIINDKLLKMNAEAPGSGDIFGGQDNVLAWSRDHLYYMQQQMEQMAMMAEQQGTGPDGKPKQQRLLSVSFSALQLTIILVTDSYQTTSKN